MKLLILDRDGTLNRSRDDYVASADEWEALPGALEAVARLNHGGWRVVIATNQSGLGRGLFDVASLNAIHAKMHRALATVGGRVEAVFFCPHAPEDACHCRKPAPGLFEQIGDRFGVPLDRRKLHAQPTVRGCAPGLSVLQSLQLSQYEAIGCVSDSGPGFVGASHAAAIATGATRERPGTALALTLEGCCASIRLRRACSTMKHA